MAESPGAVDESVLKGQLGCLQDQARQLSSLVGDDPQSPLLPLQRELEVAIAGIRQKLSSSQGEQEAQAADPTATAPPSSLPQQHEHEGEKNTESWGDDAGGGGGGGGGGDGSDPDRDSAGAHKGTSDRYSSAAKGRQFAAGDPCLAPRVFDRRRARAVVEEVLPAGSSGSTCLVTWLHPRQRGELVCRYWKEGRSCKFSGPDCPFSHGVEVSMSDLLPDNDSRDWEAPSPRADAAAVAEDDGDNTAAAWLLKDKQGDEEARNIEAAKASATYASNGSSSSSSSSSRGRTANKSRGGSWLAVLRSGSRVLARYHDRVWYEAAAEGPVTAGKQLSVRFRGFEDDGPVVVPANSAHLAPLEVEDGGGRGGRRRGRGEGAAAASSNCEGEGEGKDSDLEDAWADAAAGGSGGGDVVSAERFFQERVLGDRREVSGSRGGSGAAGGGGREGREGGLCSDAYVFGDWEQHTKGFGSRMMNRMGYRRGEGLGKEKQGISRPVPIRVLPERRALDHLRVDDGGAAQRAGSTSDGKKKSRLKSKPGGSSNHGQGGGGSGGGGGMFNFLNKTMHASMNKGKAAAAVSAGAGRSSGRLLLAERRAGPSVFGAAGPLSSSATGADSLRKSAVFPDKSKKAEGTGGKAAAASSGMSQLELRSHLVEAREAESTLAAKIGRLQETIARNSERDPRTAAQARRKLEEVRLQAAEVRASRDRAERLLGNRGLDGGGGGGGSGGGSKSGKRGRGKGGIFSF